MAHLAHITHAPDLDQAAHSLRRLAFIVARPFNLWLIGRGRGHTEVQELHEGH